MVQTIKIGTNYIPNRKPWYFTTIFHAFRKLKSGQGEGQRRYVPKKIGTHRYKPHIPKFTVSTDSHKYTSLPPGFAPAAVCRYQGNSPAFI